MTGLVGEAVRKRGATCCVAEMQKMIRDTKEWRAEVAKQLGVQVSQVKKGVNAMLFGMSLCKWKRSTNIPDSTRSPALDRLEKEIKAARVLIIDDEIKNGKAGNVDKPTRTLSRAIERIEEELMAGVISYLQDHGWVTSSLIHDEIIIQHSAKFLTPNDELQSLTSNAKLSLRKFEDSRGWPPGSLQIEIQRL